MTELSPAEFKDVALEGIAKISVRDTPRRQVLWVLEAADSLGDGKLTASEIEHILKKAFRIDVPWQAINGVKLLSGKPRPVRSRKTKRGKSFEISQEGRSELSEQEELVTYIDPSRALSNMRTVEKLLSSLSGHMQLCDPYVNERTLDRLVDCTGVSEIKLLTTHLQPTKVRIEENLRAFRQQHKHVSIEVRVALGRELHDRYILDDKNFYLLGTSLNNIGLKQSFIVRLGGNRGHLGQVVVSEFNRLWSTGTVV